MTELPQSIGPYAVRREIGRGGMGVVYLARDAKLARDVAVKALPADLADDADRLARFEREARLLASLHHANIAGVYGLEEIDGVRYLVLEYVDGEDLSARLLEGPLPLDEALEIALQIAAAVEAAHAKGVIHRDLKPANVKITDDGEVKVLDFGLAKNLGEAPVSEGSSPTVVPGGAGSPTMPGVILGTAGYMSPEQTKGKPIDKRSDIWSFGCVVYEMLTGTCPFPGETVTESIGATIHKDVEWTRLPPRTPPAVRSMLRRCLQKDRHRRLQDIGDARLELEDVLSGATSAWSDAFTAPESGPATGPRWPGLPWAAVLVTSVAAAVFAALYFLRLDATPPAVIRAAIPAPDNAEFAYAGDLAGPVAVSPDGRTLAFAALGKTEPRRRLLWVRPLDAGTARPLPGTEGANFPFWSPDGREIAFFDADADELRRISLAGGPPMTICPVATGRGGTWSPDGFILLAPGFRTPIYRVPVAGGTPVAVTTIDETKHTSHRWPFLLPGGEQFVFSAIHHEPSRAADNGIYLASADGSPARRIVHSNANAEFAGDHLVYVQGNTLVADRFDPDTGQLDGHPVAVASDVSASAGTWRAGFSVSPGGVLAYHAGAMAWGEGVQLTWYDRQGHVLKTIDQQTSQASLTVSPAGDRLAFAAAGGDSIDIWTYDLARGVPTRLTFLQGTEAQPVFSPDGTEIAFGLAFTTSKDAKEGLYRIPVGGGAPQLLLADDWSDGLGLIPTDWSPDGRYIMFLTGEYVSDSFHDMWLLPTDGGEPFLFTETTHDENLVKFSPNGRWIAYESDQSGLREIYVTEFVTASGNGPPARPGATWQISTGGGVMPCWRRDGTELFYLSNTSLMAVEVDTAGPRLEIGGIRQLFPVNVGPGNTFGVSPDGEQFIFSSPAEVSTRPINLILNWTQGLD